MLEFFRISKGLEIDRSVKVLRGGGPPGSTTDTINAQVGSIYLDTGGDLYVKQNAGSGFDKWEVLATEDYVAASTSWREPAEVVDRVAAVVPTGTPSFPIIIDGQSITGGQRVLFSAIVGSGGPNVYIYDQPTGIFTEDTNQESHGDALLIKRGTYANRVFVYIGTDWLTYDAIFQNTVFVQQDPGIDQYDSIADALDYVATQSPIPSNHWTVIVFPGTYTESALVIPPSTHLTAVTEGTATIIPSNPADDVVTMSNDSGLIGFMVSGATSGRGVVIKDVDHVLVSRMHFEDNESDIYIEGDAVPTVAHLHDINSHGGATHQYGIQVVSTGGQSTTVDVLSSVGEFTPSTGLIRALSVVGTGAIVTFQNIGISGDEVGVGLYIEDGATVSSSGLMIRDVGLGVHVPNVGAGSKIYLQAQIIQDDLPNILIEHAGTVGFFAGSADPEEVIVASGASLSLSYTSTDSTEPENIGFSLIGSLLLGAEQGNATNVTDLIQQASATGSLLGGVITTTINPLEVSVSNGYGYLINSVTMRAQKIVWITTLLTVDDDTSNYIYVDESQIVQFANSLPDTVQTILLGRVLTRGGNIALVADIPIVATQSATFLDDFLRKAVGSLFGSGCLVSEDATPLELDISSGTYYYSKQTFTPSGGTSVSFTRHFHTAGTPDSDTSTIADNTQYNDLTNLTALTVGFYTKHTLYLAGDDGNEIYNFVYGQAEHATLLAAETAPLPTPPSFLALDINVPIAAIIVQEGNPNIVEIIDIRPRLGFQSPAISGVVKHGDLTGLLNDDHPQYLLVSGTRAMSGNLNMGGNSVTNVNLVDGVDVSTHGSRHGATSADPISTAAPITTLTPVTTNAAGIADTLSRSDHTHAITGFQTLDSDLTALAAIATTGLYVITGTGTSTTRTLVAPAAGISISTADGVAGNPTFVLANDLAALEGLGSTGFAVRTGGDTWTQRTITGTASRISVSNGSGVAGNPSIDIDAAYVGQTSITTLGTISTGTWSATTIATNRGGTGLTSIGSASQVLGVNTGATALEYKTITAGSGITITPAAGAITIATAGAFVQRFTFQADQFDNPVTANWAVNSLAPATADTANSGLTIRNFDDTIEEGVGGQFTIPSGAVNVVFYFKSRARTAPGAPTAIQPTLYHRSVPDNAVVGAWSAALNLTTISIPTNTNFQYDNQTITLASLGWSVGTHYQFELTRRGTEAGDTHTGDWYLLEMIVEFTT